MVITTEPIALIGTDVVAPKGVDILQKDFLANGEVFSEYEKKCLRAASSDERRKELMLLLWAFKEAYAKVTEWI